MQAVTLTVLFNGFDYGDDKARWEIKDSLLIALEDMADSTCGRSIGVRWKWDEDTAEIEEEYQPESDEETDG